MMRVTMKQLKLIGLIVMFIAMCTCAHSASAVSVVSVEPGNVEVTGGESFTVNIMVVPSGSEIYGAQYKLCFDNTLLNVIKQSQGTFLGQDGVGTNIYANKINNKIGMIEYGETKIGVDYGVTDPGILSTITFNATGSGVCELTLDTVKLSDNNGNQIQIEVNNGTCNIVSIEPTPPPAPSTTSTSIPTTAPIQTPSGAVTTGTANETITDSSAPPHQQPQPDQTATSSNSAPIQTQQPDEGVDQSGYASAFTATGLLIVSYLILRKEH